MYSSATANCAKEPKFSSYPHTVCEDDVAGSAPSRMSSALSSHWLPSSTTSSPGFSVRTSSPTAHTTPEPSEPPMWKGSVSPRRARAATTSTGWPSAAQTLL